jgi:holo-[acyl-carrier protein] synthase
VLRALGGGGLPVIVAIGIDSIAIARIEALWLGNRERFLSRVFTAAEAAYCRQRAQPAESLAARFCAKEAAMKCLRTGWAEGIGFRQIEVVRADTGAVTLQLHGEAGARAARLGIRRCHLSLTHTATLATAFVIAEG